MPETLYEYQKDWAKPGSRTGKRVDDARPMTKLVWGEKKKQGKLQLHDSLQGRHGPGVQRAASRQPDGKAGVFVHGRGLKIK